MKAKLSCLLMCFALFGGAFAAMWEIKEPGLALPEAYPAAARDQVRAVLRRPDCKFVGGTAFNSSTSLRYQGETIPLNLFLEALIACPGLTISMRFHHFAADAGFDWMVQQDGLQPARICVRVNLDSPRVKIDELVVPDRHGPSLPSKE